MNDIALSLAFCTSLLLAMFSCAAEPEGAQQDLHEDAARTTTDRVIRDLGKGKLSDIAEAYGGEKDAMKMGQIGALLANQSSIFNLLEFRDQKEQIALAVFAEWQLVVRQLDANLLEYFERPENRRRPRNLRYSLRQPNNRRGQLAIPEEVSLMERFMQFIEERDAVDIPLPWRQTISHSAYYGAGVVNAVAALPNDAVDVYKSSKQDVRRSQTDEGSAVIQNESRTWKIRLPASGGIEAIDDYATNGEWCYVVAHSDMRERLDLRVCAYKTMSTDCHWSKHCITYMSTDAKLGAQNIYVFLTISQSKNTIAIFVIYSHSFAIDVLDLRTGERKWCFASMLPKLMEE